MEMNELRRARESRERDQDGRLTLPDFEPAVYYSTGTGQAHRSVENKVHE